MKKITTFCLGFLLCFNLAFACINDHSSKFFEEQRFPDEEELISGSFQIHSQEFHAWRIKDRLDKLQKNPDNPELIDDLAVSYDKTGNFPKAIEILDKSLIKNPDRYGTLANLGTFYIHHKEYQKGLAFLKKAIKINPQAHYGREIYQIKIVEYVLLNNKDISNKFPIQKENNFADYILKDIPKDKQKDELISAIVGLSGMLKFGNSDSSILLEGLGDLYDRLFSDYTLFESNNNPLIDYAKQFYIASFFKVYPNSKDYSILIKFLDSKKIPFNYNSDINKVRDHINSGENSRTAYIFKEQEILLTSSDPENQIYRELFQRPKKQEDLFKEKKESVDNVLNYSKRQLLGNVLTNIGYLLQIFSGLLFIFIWLYSTITFNILYFKNKKNNILDNDKQNINWGFFIFNSLLILLVTTLFGNYFDMQDLVAGLVVGFIIIGILAICFLIFIQWVEFTSENLKYMKLLEYLRFINKFSLYFLIATIIINIVFYTIMFDSGSGIKTIQ